MTTCLRKDSFQVTGLKTVGPNLMSTIHRIKLGLLRVQFRQVLLQNTVEYSIHIIKCAPLYGYWHMYIISIISSISERKFLVEDVF